MRAIRLHEFGPAERLVLDEVDDPKPGAGEVRIVVRAAGVHVVDTALRAGTAGPPFQLPDLPATLGRDAAGVVDAVGADVGDEWLGRRVVAYLGPRSGGYAELVVAPASALHPLPDGVPFDAAVAMIGTGRTTLAILDTAEVSAADVAVVTAAAGGIGNLLVQAVRAAGATVVGLAGGAAKAGRVRRLGADVAVDYDRPGWPDAVRAALGDRQVTLVFDGVGGDLGRGALELLGPGGRVVFYGWSSGTPTRMSTEDLFERGIAATAAVGARFTARAGGLREYEERALRAVADGTLHPLVTRFPLRDAAAAHRALERRATTGKVVLVP